MANFITRVFGSRNQRLLKQYSKSVARINSLEEETRALSDADLAARTVEFKQRVADGESLTDLLEEAFAVAREAAQRTLGMRPFDVQLIGGMVLHDGNIAEMRTGEGKTLVATLPAYLNALSGEGVHIVTVNEYLRKKVPAPADQLQRRTKTGILRTERGPQGQPGEIHTPKRRLAI